MRPNQALNHAQKALGPSAVIECTVTLYGTERRETWSVGVRGSDEFAWSCMGVSPVSFEEALAQARAGGTRRKKK